MKLRWIVEWKVYDFDKSGIRDSDLNYHIVLFMESDDRCYAKFVKRVEHDRQVNYDKWLGPGCRLHSFCEVLIF